MSERFVVIGAGVSGMAAALILARHGKKVTLVESAAKPGPLLRGFTRHGLHFDSGFHYAGGLGKGQILSAYLEHLGVQRHIQLAPQRVQDTLRLLDRGQDIDLPYDYASLEESLTGRFPDERAGIRSYLEAVRAIFEATPFLNLEAEEEPDFTPFRGQTLENALQEWIRDAGLRHALGLQHFFYGVSPKRISLVDHARFAGSYYASTRFVVKGGLALAQGFENALQQAGVRVLCGSAASAVMCSPAGNLCGVKLHSGEELECSGVIATVHPQVLTRIVPTTAFRPAYAANLQGLEETPSAYMLFGVSQEPLPFLEKGALHLSPCADYSLEGLERQTIDQRLLFLARAGEKDGRGRQPLGLICPAQHTEMDVHAAGNDSRGPQYAACKQELAEMLEARMLEACPELRGRWRMLEAATPLTFKRYAGSPTGSLYGVQHAMDAHCPLPQTRLPGLYVAGQAVAGPGVLGATVSAYVACSRIFGLRSLLGEVRQCL